MLPSAPCVAVAIWEREAERYLNLSASVATVLSHRGARLRSMNGRECRQIDLLHCVRDGVLVAISPVRSIAQAR
jgi:hypothetical protein